ncbi:hypothetical protein BU15DRAFT_63086 [Melanogaster broomeanus]|nr:hypothetical protein BU15DRAFT_63086 [Melanogaster broomeanus]
MPSNSYSQPLPLPVEVICNILSFLDPYEIVCLRVVRPSFDSIGIALLISTSNLNAKVSKQFRDFTHDTQLWRTVYVNARLPRPPGPFPSQSTAFLESTLLHSEQLSRKWTSKPVKITARVLPAENPLQWALLFGRWIVWSGDEMDIRCRDLDAGTEQLLWQAGDKPLYFVACSTTSADGRLIYIIVYDVDESETRSTPLLEYRVQEDSCFLSDPVSHVVPCLEGRLRVNGQMHYKLSFLDGDLVLEYRTRRFYKLPPIHPEFDTTEFLSEHSILPLEVILTKTHIITFYYSWAARMTLIRAFIIPDSPVPSGSSTDYVVNELRLTHETSMDQRPSSVVLIRDSVVDNITRVTNLKFMVGFHDAGQTDYRCVELTLAEPCAGAVTPMSTCTQHLFTIYGESAPAFAGGSGTGYVRGFVAGLLGNSFLATWVAAKSIQKFTIDASQKTCTAVLGEPTQ